jgi:hypothetical protein
VDSPQDTTFLAGPLQIPNPIEEFLRRAPDDNPLQEPLTESLGISLGISLEISLGLSLGISLVVFFKKSPENPSEVPYRKIFRGVLGDGLKRFLSRKP